MKRNAVMIVFIVELCAAPVVGQLAPGAPQGPPRNAPPVAQISGEALELILAVLPRVPKPLSQSLREYVIKVGRVENGCDDGRGLKGGYWVEFSDAQRYEDEEGRRVRSDMFVYGGSTRVQEFWFRVSPDRLTVKGPIYTK